ncbi:MAG: NahK/ErcS family hybrid sensor histidine kinase/response regulator, partial [Pseudomonadota bacterium]
LRTDLGTPTPIEREVMRDLADRFLPSQRVQLLFGEARPSRQLESTLEHELAAVVGAASSRLLLDAARKRTPAPLDTVADLVGQAAAQARFSQGVLSGALENMSQGICVVDAEMQLVAWNSAYLDLFDYPPDLIRVGRPVADLLRHNADQGLMGEGDLAAKIDKRLAFKRSGSRHVIERSWSDGRIIEIRGNPMPGGGFVATFTDVTAFRKTAEELKVINETLEHRVLERTRELEQAKLYAERASEAKTRFLAAVSHDLVQPLNAAQLLTHALGSQLDQPKQVEPLRQISGALAATENLLEGLLDISRLDAGGLEPRITRFPLGDLLNQLAAEFRLMAQERGLDLRCVKTSVWVESDPQMLRRILQNFLSNAVRYTEQGRILIGCQRRGDEVLVGVLDTGPGIPAEEHELIFEEFRRRERDEQAPGLGLGLSIAERMARLLGHRLTLNSREGEGTVLRVAVPMVPPEPEQPDAPASEASASAGRALIIDNDPSMLASLSKLLRGWGFEVQEGSDANSALAAWQDRVPELMILDYHLNAGRTGLDVIEALRAEGHVCPVIMISADHASDVRQAARQAGCEFLHKPIRPLALKSLAMRLIRSH